jgi:hypothetical protein
VPAFDYRTLRRFSAKMLYAIFRPNHSNKEALLAGLMWKLPCLPLAWGTASQLPRGRCKMVAGCWQNYDFMSLSLCTDQVWLKEINMGVKLRRGRLVMVDFECQQGCIKNTQLAGNTLLILNHYSHYSQCVC